MQDDTPITKTLTLSSPGLKRALRYEMNNQFVVQVLGRSRFLLFPPDQAPLVHLHPRLHPYYRTAQLDVDAPDFVAFPDARHLHGALEVTLSAGDILFVPQIWLFHEVSLLDGGLSATVTVASDGDVKLATTDIFRTMLKVPDDATALERVTAYSRYIDHLLLLLRIDSAAFAKKIFVSKYAALKAELAISPQYEFVEQLCAAAVDDWRRKETALESHIFGQLQDAAKIAAEYARKLSPVGVRSDKYKVSAEGEMVLSDYVDVLLFNAVGGQHDLLIAFLEGCFRK